MGGRQTGCWGFDLENRQAWTCQVSLCGHWYIQRQEARRYRPIIPQLRCEGPFSFLLLSLITACVYNQSSGLSSLLLQVPHVNRTDYQLIDISEDGFVSNFLWPFWICAHSLYLQWMDLDKWYIKVPLSSNLIVLL